jgi:hypothetical protein
LPKKTPKLTNHKDLGEDEEEIADETPAHDKDKYIEDFYDDNYSDDGMEELDDDEKMDMDYSQSQLDDFLKS